MTPAEYELLLHDAEVKLARLKALYEQYFQGIERLEPAVPRKEVDRVMELLRKQQPRNTALRFRTQMLIAKYGTYQTYWQRIARQIEEGTFRRDVVRAQQRRQRDQGRARATERENEGPSAWELDVDVELEPPSPAAASPAAASAGGASAGGASPVRPSTGAPSFDDSDIDAILGSLGGRPSEPVPPRRVLSPFASPGARTVPPRAAGTSPAPAPALEAAAQPSTPQGPAGGAPKPITTFGKPGIATFAKPGAAPRPAVAAPAGAPAGAAPPAVAGPEAAPRAAPAAPAPPPAAAARPPAAAARPAAPPRPPAPAPPRPAGVAPAPPRPAPPPPPGSPARPAPPAAAPPRPPTAPDDARMRKIYETYVEARRRNNERVDNVRYETVAQSVQQLIPKLREKHGNRPIDFEVVVQNGKVGLKPKVGG